MGSLPRNRNIGTVAEMEAVRFALSPFIAPSEVVFAESSLPFEQKIPDPDLRLNSLVV